MEDVRAEDAHGPVKAASGLQPGEKLEMLVVPVDEKGRVFPGGQVIEIIVPA
jgi:hypothetical protein